MAEQFVHFAFTAGELSPKLEWRSDLEKYQLGVRRGENFIIDYRGGAQVRPPLEFVDEIPGEYARIEPFNFNLDEANKYMVVFTSTDIRLLQNGRYLQGVPGEILSVAKGVTTVVTTSVPHGLDNFDMIKLGIAAGMVELDNRVLRVTVINSTSFKVRDINYKEIDSTNYGDFSFGSFAKLLRIDTPYQGEILKDLKLDQFRDELYITHPDHPPAVLRRLGFDNWQYSPVDFSGNDNAPTGLTHEVENSGGSGAVYAVTAVNLSGEESYIKEFYEVDDSNNITSSAGSVRLRWPPVANAIEYRIYRSLFYPESVKSTIAQALGFLGRTVTTNFIDNNIIPDFTTLPPQKFNPFENGAVRLVNMTSQGSGYNDAVSVSVPGGSGFVGYPVLDDTGAVLSVLIQDGGKDYTDGDAVTFSGGAGSGAAGTIVATPLSANYPTSTARIQQRRFYAGTKNNPVGLWASKPGLQNNFFTSPIVTAADSFSLTLDAPDLTPIRHMTQISSDILIFLETRVSLLRGADDGVISALNFKQEPISFTGANSAEPLRVDDQILYVSHDGTAVHAVSPTNLRNYYKTSMVSLYSNHLFSAEDEIVSWSNAPSPSRLITAATKKGALRFFTYIPDQNVYSWTPGYTDGEVVDVASIREGDYDYTYAVVRRNGTLLLERFRPLVVKSAEDLGSCDSFLETSLRTFDATVYSEVVDGLEQEVTSDVDVFTTAHVGRHLRMGGGRAIVLEYVNPRKIIVTWELEILEVNKQTKKPLPVTAGNWTLDPLFSALRGLWHLEGREVQVFADGGDFSTYTVSNGSITLNSPASRVMAGLAFNADLETLPITSLNKIIQHKRKRVANAGLRLHNSRGLLVASGESDKFYELKDRTTESYGTPTRLQTGLFSVAISSSWNTEGSVKISKRGPIGATILGCLLEIELGDDDD